MTNRSKQIRLECTQPADRPYLEKVQALVLQQYDGQGPHWQLQSTENLWPISLGGRAGVVGVRIDQRTCCVKLFYDQRWTTRLRTFWGRAKARRAYHNALALCAKGVTCPSPLGYAERRPTGPTLLITELINNGQRLDHWIMDHGVSRSLIMVMARFLRHMHDSGFTHKDLSPRNVLIGSEDQGPTPYILDYEDIRCPAPVSLTNRLDNLHHLDERLLQILTLRERLQFLRAYAKEDYCAYRKALGKKLIESQSKYVQEYRKNLTQRLKKGLRTR